MNPQHPPLLAAGLFGKLLLLLSIHSCASHSLIDLHRILDNLSQLLIQPQMRRTARVRQIPEREIPGG